MPKFADVILPLPLADTFTYSVPAEFEERIAEGCRVTVPLGKSKHYTALVQRLHDEEPEGYAVRPIDELLDDAPIVLPTRILCPRAWYPAWRLWWASSPALP